MPRPTGPVISAPRPLTNSAYTNTNANSREHKHSLSSEPKLSSEPARSYQHHGQQKGAIGSGHTSKNVQVKFKPDDRAHKGERKTRRDEKPPDKPPKTDATPSIKLLFSLVTRRDLFLFFLPAIFMSIISGGIAPYMTFVVGQAFDAFSQFSLSEPSREDRVALRREVGIVAIQLVALGVAVLALSSATSALWICTGERNLMRLRTRIYDAVMDKSMEWFESKMGSAEKADAGDEDRSGSGGMMAKFAM